MTKEERIAKSQACIEWIRARLQEGRDVYITTYTRSTRFRPRHIGRLDDYLRASSGGHADGARQELGLHRRLQDFGSLTVEAWILEGDPVFNG